MTESPETGLVVRYSFLWPREHDRGEREGRKDRPVCLVVPVNVGPGAVVVFPITTLQPLPGRTAVAVPETERRRLKLPGDRPCWIMLDEANSDVMPGSFHLVPLELRPLALCLWPVQPGLHAGGAADHGRDDPSPPGTNRSARALKPRARPRSEPDPAIRPLFNSPPRVRST